jgi:hypothetical protein
LRPTAAAAFIALLIGSACGRSSAPEPNAPRRAGEAPRGAAAAGAVAGPRPLSETADKQKAVQSHHSATLLPSGRVFVGMGYKDQVQPGQVFDLRSGTFSGASSLSPAKSWPWRQTGSLLPTGDTLVSGGIGGDAAFETSNGVFSLRAGSDSWEPEAFLGFARENHTSTVLQDGTVIAAGGHSTVAGPWRSVDRRDPRTGSWRRTFDLTTSRDSGTGTLLEAGGSEYILFVGGGSSTSEVCDTTPGGTCRVVPLPGWWFWDPTATQLANGRVLVIGASRNPSVAGSQDTAVAALFIPGNLADATPGTWVEVSRPTHARHGHSATLLASGKVLVSGGNDAVAAAFTESELYDPVTDTWTTTPGSSAWLDAATLLPSGQVLFTGIKAQIFDPGGESWGPGVALAGGRTFATATVLATGQVLIAGGQDAAGAARGDAVVYQAGVGSSGQVALQAARRAHTATLLPGGKILLAGGYGSANQPLASAELFSPETGVTSLASQGFQQARADHRAALLPSGRVLISGGVATSGGDPIATALLYAPAAGTWSDAGSIGQGRTGHTATPFSFQVGSLSCLDCALVVGGRGGASVPAMAAPMIFEGRSGTWTAASADGYTPGEALLPRRDHAAVLLPSGSILIVGGTSETGAALASTQEYDPRTNRWKTRSPLASARARHQATVLSTGKVLVTGGVDRDAGGVPVLSAELYDPYTDRWTTVGATVLPHEGGCAVVLPDRTALVIGGLGAGGASVERFDDGLAPLPALTPTLTGLPPAATAGETLRVTGTRLKGRSEGGSGTFQSSNTNFPLVTLQHQDSGRVDFATTSDWTPTSTNATLPKGLPAGRYWLRIVANGAPSAAQPIEVAAPGPVIEPVTSVAPGESRRLTATAGAQAWGLRSAGSGGAVVSPSGGYTAGRAGNTIDVVEVKDSGGLYGTALIRVGPGISVLPALAGATPGAQVQLKARGGTGGGYAWSLKARGSGPAASITSAGLYTAGAVNGTDLIQAMDPLGNVGMATVEVGRAVHVTATLANGQTVEVAPGIAVAISPGDAIHFTASGGSGHGYVWSPIVDHDFVNWSSIDASSGLYQNGGFGWLQDRVRVQDSDGRLTEVRIDVGPPFLVSPLEATVPASSFLTFLPNRTATSWHVQGCEPAPDPITRVQLCCTTPEPCAGIAETGRYQAGPTTTYVDEVWSALGRHAFVTVVAAAPPGTAQVLPIHATVWPSMVVGSSFQPGGRVQFEVPGSTVQGWTVGRLLQGTFVAGSAIGSTISASGLYEAGPNDSADTVTEYVQATLAGGGQLPAASVKVLARLSCRVASGAAQEVNGVAYVPVHSVTSFAASGGLQDGSGGSLATFNLQEGGSVDAVLDQLTGRYIAGSIPGVEDHILVTDGVFPPVDMKVRIVHGGGLAIRPATPVAGTAGAFTVDAAPREPIAFWTTGGSQFLQTWTFEGAKGSGTAASLEGATGLYRAGDTGSTTDHVRVTDDATNTATVTINVGKNLALSGPTGVIEPGKSREFTVSGGKAPYTWTIDPNQSEARLVPTADPNTYQYIAGTSTEVRDVVVVEDAVLARATADVDVRTPPPKAGGCASGGGGLLSLLLLAAAAATTRRGRRPSSRGSGPSLSSSPRRG